MTDAVLEEVAAWQARPLEPVYPMEFFDALRIKVRDEGEARNKAVNIALGVRARGAREVLTISSAAYLVATRAILIGDAFRKNTLEIKRR